MKKIKIISLILLALILATYYPFIAGSLDKHTFYSYRDITGQEWEISKVNNKKIEHPINVFDKMSDEEIQQHNTLKDELDKQNQIISDNQKVHDNYLNDQYTGGLTFDDLGINGGNTLSDWEVTSILHEEAQKRLKKRQDQYMDAVNNANDIKHQIDYLKNLLIKEAWDLRNIVNNVRIFLIVGLILLIFSTKLFRLSKKTFSFIIND